MTQGHYLLGSYLVPWRPQSAPIDRRLCLRTAAVCKSRSAPAALTRSMRPLRAWRTFRSATVPAALQRAMSAGHIRDVTRI